jgi:hypothetical protein
MSSEYNEEPALELNESEIDGTQDVITWDDFHCSPRAEIVLVSKDMVGFRVDAWYMRMKW